MILKDATAVLTQARKAGITLVQQLDEFIRKNQIKDEKELMEKLQTMASDNAGEEWASTLKRLREKQDELDNLRKTIEEDFESTSKGVSHMGRYASECERLREENRVLCVAMRDMANQFYHPDGVDAAIATAIGKAWEIVGKEKK